jgi:hypothetical protein
VEPTDAVRFAGDTVIDRNVGEVSVVEPEIPPELAVIVVLPPTGPAVAWPAELIVAAPVFEELQVTELVRSLVLLSE